MFHKWFGKRKDKAPSQPSKDLEVTNSARYTVRVNRSKTGSEGLTLQITPPVRPNPNASQTALHRVREQLEETVVHFGSLSPTEENAKQLLAQINERIEKGVQEGALLPADSQYPYTKH